MGARQIIAIQQKLPWRTAFLLEALTRLVVSAATVRRQAEAVRPSLWHRWMPR